MRQITINICQYDELSLESKPRAEWAATQHIRDNFNDSFMIRELNHKAIIALDLLGFTDIKLFTDHMSDDRDSQFGFTATMAANPSTDVINKLDIVRVTHHNERLNMAINCMPPITSPVIVEYANGVVKFKGVPQKQRSVFREALTIICHIIAINYKNAACDAYCSMNDIKVKLRHIQENNLEFYENGNLFENNA